MFDMERQFGAKEFSVPKLLLLMMLVFEISLFGGPGVNGDFENSWTMYMEQPCCSGTGSHHVRHHRGKVGAVRPQRLNRHQLRPTSNLVG